VLALPRSAEACTGGPNGPAEIVAAGDIAFAGEVISVRVANEYWSGINHFVPVWVDFRVDQYLKGSGPKIFSGLDPVSVIFDDLDDARAGAFERASFMGAAGACGALWENPLGQYWVAAATLVDGNYQLVSPLIATKGTGADDPSVRAALEALAAAGVAPAAAGQGVRSNRDRSTAPIVLSALALMLVGSARALTSKPAGRGRAR